MNKNIARATIKAINRWVRNYRPFEGGKAFGVDYVTWRISYPQIAKTYQEAAEVVTGRTNGRFMPRF